MPYIHSTVPTTCQLRSHYTINVKSLTETLLRFYWFRFLIIRRPEYPSCYNPIWKIFKPNFFFFFTGRKKDLRIEKSNLPKWTLRGSWRALEGLAGNRENFSSESEYLVRQEGITYSRYLLVRDRSVIRLLGNWVVRSLAVSGNSTVVILVDKEEHQHRFR